jgi:hypothetical protein
MARLRTSVIGEENMLATYLGQYRGDLCISLTIAGDVVVAGGWQSLEYGRR